MYMQLKITLIFFFILFTNNIFAKDKDYFMSLKYNTVNVRQGPSSEHPIKFIYKKKYLPIKIIDNFENYRKFIDLYDNSGWIHISQLSSKKTALNIKEKNLLLKKPQIYSKPLAQIEKGKLIIIKKCKDNWCKVLINKYVGWIRKNTIWGRT
tara:strand:+ start:951 stop:1406 length:456 start_codon:yes stop_codon:yes gene_type:complete